MGEIQLRNLSKRWGSFVGVDKFDLTISDREFLVLLGPSGCGKTTTMRMIAGLETPTDGEIFVDGAKINDLEPKDRDVAMVFQNYGLYPTMTVRENIRFPLKVRGVPRAEHDAMIQRAADMVELGDLLDRLPKELSGGQRQRVALARAIVRRPTVFLMDEPLSNLDAKLRVSTRAQIKNLQHELAVTTIYVTHDQIEAMTLADRVVVMNKGEIQQIGTPTEIYDRPANTFVAGFIGSPAMNLVSGSISGGTFTGPNVTIKGLKADDGAITLGFRAEDVEVVKRGGDAKAPVYSMELLGDATQVSIRSGSEILSGKAPKDFRAEIGAPIGFKIDAAVCHLFDPQTGARL
ncbi:MAG: ABC transporter ATP-binding protein [Alphaproteobacteria bacterium]|nr:ABC transporter ATP-binding protein [Alphaproteobacteria bacterium]